MNSLKNTYSIKDLENLSGIKAHTIRIWEKRYNILEPMRTDTNIRLYNPENLQKLLNITLLHGYGYKISTISKYPAEKIPQLVSEIVSAKSAKTHAISSFKVAMLNFDQSHFLNTYNKLLSEKSFREIFNDVLLPLLKELGSLWLSGTITPAQEHFICNLIRHKLIINIENAQLVKPIKTDRVFVLYLPSGEIHDLALMYINYEFLLNGFQTVYLGTNIPMENLKDLQKNFNAITYVSYLTVQPEANFVNEYVELMNKEVMHENSELWLAGKQTKNITSKISDSRNRIFNSAFELISQL